MGGERSRVRGSTETWWSGEEGEEEEEEGVKSKGE